MARAQRSASIRVVFRSWALYSRCVALEWLEVGATNDYFRLHAFRSSSRPYQDGRAAGAELLHRFPYDPTARSPSWTWKGWTASRSPE